MGELSRADLSCSTIALYAVPTERASEAEGCVAANVVVVDDAEVIGSEFKRELLARLLAFAVNVIAAASAE